MASRLAVYAELLADPAARSFTVAGLLARFPMSMTGLGLVLLVSIQTGSFARAGLVAATATVGAALTAPWWGRRMDRVGQAPVLLITVGCFAVGAVGVIAAVLSGSPLPVVLLAAALTGVGASVAGACVRARWSHRFAADGRLREVAYAYEAVMDEVVFIVGPVLATFLATALHPALGLAAAVLLGLAGTLWLAAQRATQPPLRSIPATHPATDPAHPTGSAPTTRTRPVIVSLWPVVLACAALGGLFGGMEVVIVAFATEAGILSYAGVLAMAWALGSLVAGVATGTVVWRASPVRRFRIAALLLAASVVPLTLVGAPVAVAALLVLSGLAIAPTLIASVAVTQASAPAGRLTEALGWTQLGLYAGVGAGAAVSGRVIDTAGAHGGFVVLTAIGGLLVLAALTVRPNRTSAGGRERMVPSG